MTSEASSVASARCATVRTTTPGLICAIAAAADSTFGSYYLAMATSPFIVWASFADFNLEPGAPVMKLDLRNNPDYHGNTAKQFVKADLAELIPD